MAQVDPRDGQGPSSVRPLRTGRWPGTGTPARLAFSCYVFTADGRLLLTMRGPKQRSWPGMWANSCYGQPGPGETLAGAVARALGDELGLRSVAAEPILPAFRYQVSTGDGVTGELCPVYRVVTDEPPHPDPGAVGDFEWVGWADFVYAVATGDITVPPWCRPQVAELDALGTDPARWPVTGAAVHPAA